METRTISCETKLVRTRLEARFIEKRKDHYNWNFPDPGDISICLRPASNSDPYTSSLLKKSCRNFRCRKGIQTVYARNPGPWQLRQPDCISVNVDPNPCIHSIESMY